MKSILTLLLATLVTIGNAQSLCKVDAPLKFFPSQKTAFPDTLRFKVFPKSKYPIGDRAAAFEYPIQGESTFDHYPIAERNGEVVIQNSFRKGGLYVHPSGKKFGYAIFWTRVVNKTDAPIAFTISSPADSFAIDPSTGSYMKIFLPTDTMTFDKTILYSYGTDLPLFLDTYWNDRITVQRTIEPKGEHLFYIAVLCYQGGSGIRQAELVLKDGKLFYSLSGTGSPELDSKLIPAGDLN